MTIHTEQGLNLSTKCQRVINESKDSFINLKVPERQGKKHDEQEVKEERKARWQII